MSPQMIQILGAAATLYGLGGAFSVLLQARRMRVRGTSGDVSARFFAVYVGGFAIWLLYGLGIGDVPIIVVHAVGLLCGSVTLTTIIRLRKPGTGAATPRPAEDPTRIRPDGPPPREPAHRSPAGGRPRPAKALATTRHRTSHRTGPVSRRRSRPRLGTLRHPRHRAMARRAPVDPKIMATEHPGTKGGRISGGTRLPARA